MSPADENKRLLLEASRGSLASAVELESLAMDARRRASTLMQAAFSPGDRVWVEYSDHRVAGVVKTVNDLCVVVARDDGDEAVVLTPNGISFSDT